METTSQTDECSVLLLIGPKDENEIMCRFGLGQSGKLYGQERIAAITYRQDLDLVKVLESVVQAMEQAGYLVPYGRVLGTGVRHRDPLVHQFSLGDKFFMIDDLDKLLNVVDTGECSK
jgi:hypothetical protein